MSGSLHVGLAAFGAAIAVGLIGMLLTAVFTALICHHEEPARPDAHA